MRLLAGTPHGGTIGERYAVKEIFRMPERPQTIYSTIRSTIKTL